MGKAMGHSKGGGKEPDKNAEASREQQKAVGTCGGSISYPVTATGRKVLSQSPSPSDLSQEHRIRGKRSLT